MLDEPGFRALARRIEAAAGLDLGAYKDRCLKRRIAVRMRACGVHSYGDYVTVLDATPGELERLLDALTINVSKFFRNPETWDKVRTEVAPALLEQRPVRIWSAGCAAGEEPYTLAMLFAEVAHAMGRSAALERVYILGTDIDRRSLERAQEGRYTKAAFLEAPEDVIARWTHELPSGEIQVNDAIRRRVRVMRHDMVVEPPPDPPFQLIVCRNAIIYFDRPTQERLMTRFADALAPNGYLLLGKVETILGPARVRLELIEARERIYRRPA